jgi:hypothetical protein
MLAAVREALGSSATTIGSARSKCAREHDLAEEGQRGGLCRDREHLNSILKNFESTDGNASSWKYPLSQDIVYHGVYHARGYAEPFSSLVRTRRKPAFICGISVEM